MTPARDPIGETISCLPSSTMCPDVKTKHNKTKR